MNQNMTIHPVTFKTIEKSELRRLRRQWRKEVGGAWNETPLPRGLDKW